ncbi:MAG: DUF3025 domain-containing protein [Burkholderiales bacterium]
MINENLAPGVPAWDCGFLERSPMFAPLRAGDARSIGELSFWPGPQDYQCLLDSRPTPLTARSGVPIRFVAARAKREPAVESYETRVYRSGEVALRQHNWHDLFNALVWIAFPSAKAALNERHCSAMLAPKSPAGRGAVRDALTLFDESGVIVTSADAELSELLVMHRWKELFWQRRESVLVQMGFFLFGHALYEKALRPYPALTGFCLMCPVDGRFLCAPAAIQIEQLDAWLGQHIAAGSALAAPRDLAVLPLLGVPGWAGDADASFYDDTRYFRPKAALP